MLDADGIRLPERRHRHATAAIFTDLGRLQIDGGDLPLLTVLQVVVDLVAFVAAPLVALTAETCTKTSFEPVSRLDEAESPCCVKPLHSAVDMFLIPKRRRAATCGPSLLILGKPRRHVYARSMMGCEHASCNMGRGRSKKKTSGIFRPRCLRSAPTILVRLNRPVGDRCRHPLHYHL